VVQFLAHLVRSDIPFHYALADAFTICDAYHCSLLGPTDPNRYHMWTGWVGNDGKGGGPVIDNAEAGFAVTLTRLDSSELRIVYVKKRTDKKNFR
jgi:phospholipase C